MNENAKYEIIKKLVETDGNKKTAALKIGCASRTVSRLIKGYKEKGKGFFVHGNRGRKPITALSEETVALIRDLYVNKYYDSNITHYTQLLDENEGIKVSVSTVTSSLSKYNIISPKATRSTRKKMVKRLKEQRGKAKSKKEEAIIQSSILDLVDAHPRRSRCANFGELLQMDASVHNWFGNTKTHLHLAVDDSTGAIVGAYFDYQETLNGYYHVLFQILNNYGIPYEFLTDRRTVFEYKRKKQINVEKDTFTQWGYACKQLGINIQTSSIPQAKGRVERMFGTLQSRLVIELRLAGADSIDKANEFLNSYVKKFNIQFALPIDNIKSVFEMQPKINEINLILAVLSSRKIDNGSCLKYNNNYYLPVNAHGTSVHHRKGTKAMVIKAFDNELYSCIGDEVYALEMLPSHSLSSKAFDLAILPEKAKKKYIPPMNHPWRQTSFDKHLKAQVHREENMA